MRKRICLMLVLCLAVSALTGCFLPRPRPSETTEPTQSATPSQEPIETQAPSASTGGKPDFGPLSDDIYSFQIQIDEDVYQFPMTYDEFTAFGWVSKDDATGMLDANYREVSHVFEKGDLQCYGEIVNFDVNARPLNECYVGGISVDD
jgi:hypothetical protein